MATLDSKTCKDCGETKKSDCFRKNSYECKACLTTRTKRWAKTQTYRKHKKDKCERCSFIPLHSCQLDVDHIDGHHKNNDLSNLQTLCANCHRLKTFLNKEGALRYR